MFSLKSALTFLTVSAALLMAASLSSEECAYPLVSPAIERIPKPCEVS